VVTGVNFTGHMDCSKAPCPADAARPPGSESDHRRWGGNKPTTAYDHPDGWPEESLASQVLYGEPYELSTEELRQLIEAVPAGVSATFPGGMTVDKRLVLPSPAPLQPPASPPPTPTHYNTPAYCAACGTQWFGQHICSRSTSATPKSSS
jgi:hypothetical protein